MTSIAQVIRAQKEKSLPLADTEELSIFNIAIVVWRRRILLITIVVVCVALTVAFDATRTKVYGGTASMQLVSQNVTQYNGTTELTPADVATDIQLAQSQTVASLVAKKIGEIAPRDKATEVGTTNVVNIFVAASKPSFAAKVANDYVDAYIDYTTERYSKQVSGQEKILDSEVSTLQGEIQQIETEISDSGPKSSSLASLNTQLGSDSAQLQSVSASLTQLQLDEVQVPAGALSVTPATINLSPVSPKPLLDGVLAALLGLLLAIGLVFLLDSVDDRIRSREQLQVASGGLPLLGEIPFFEEWKNQPDDAVIAALRPQSAEAEAYRSLRTALQFINFDSERSNVIQITSPEENEGKTTTVIDLAVTFAAGGSKVVIVSGDLRKPGMQKFFALKDDKGLSSILGGRTALSTVIVKSKGHPNLAYIPTGPIPPNPSELLSSPKLKAILDSLRETYDVILVDSPPVLPVTDTIVLAQVVDSVVLICRSNVTRSRAVGRALELLASVEAPAKGVILNATPHPSGAGRYGRYRGYGRYRTYGTYAPQLPQPN